MWTCPSCRESIEPSFDVCWNCGTIRNGPREPEQSTHSSVDATSNDGEPVAVDAADPSRPTSPSLRVLWRALLVFGLVSIIGVGVAAWLSRPTTSDDYLQLGLLHLRDEEYPEAIVDLTCALELAEADGSGTTQILVARAAAYNNAGRHADALPDVSRAIEQLRPPPVEDDDPESRADGLFARVAYDLHERGETYSKLHLLRANVYLELGRPDDAVADLRVVLEDDPDDRDARRLLSIAEESRKSLATAR